MMLSFYLSLFLWLIHPAIGWIAFLLIIVFQIKHNKKGLKFHLIFIVMFLSLTYVASVDNNKTKGNYVGLVTTAKENYYIISSDLVNYYVYQKEHLYEVGDIVCVNAIRKELNFVALEGEFDFTNYLINQNVKYSLSPISTYQITRTVIRTRAIKRYILNWYNKQNQDFISTIIFANYNDEINIVGASFIMTSSGLIIYTLDTILKRILNRFINEDISNKIIHVTLFPLIIFSSFKIGVIKAFIFIVIKDKKINISRHKIYNLLLLICLFSNPLYMKTAEFYYAFFFPLLIRFLHEAISSFPFKYKEFISSILIQLLFVPLQIIFTKSVALFSFIYFYLFRIVFGVLFLLTYILMFFPFLSVLLDILERIYKWILTFLQVFNYSLNFINVQFYVIALLVILFIAMLITLERNNKKRAGVYLIAYSLILYLSSTSINYSTSFVAFINVGQGDCILIHDKSTNVLIDTGGNLNKNIAEDILIPYFKKQNIKKINHIFLSHDDFDHAGALNHLINNFKVENYIFGSDFKTYEVNNLTFMNLNAFGNRMLDNDDSSVLKLQFYTRTYLFCGDISETIEHKIISNYDVKADIIKISHHGSNTSSSYEFLKAVDPDEAVISVGKNNIYKHPSINVLQRLDKLNIKCRRTDQEGTIYYKENNNSILGMYFYFFEVKYELRYNIFGE